MPAGSSPLIRRKRLGDELRSLREGRKLTLQQLAAQLGWSHTKLSRLENAKIRPDVGDILDLLETLGVTGERYDRLVTLARQANSRGWWRAYSDMPARQAGYAELESGARSISQYSLVFIPGLLQTEDYAKVRFTDREAWREFDEEDAVAGRRERQRVLSGDQAVEYNVILDEGCIRRRTAPPEIMRDQLRYLLDQPANVTVRVLPLVAEVQYLAGALNSFALYRFQGDDDLVTVETETSDLQLGDDEDVARYEIMWMRLSAASLAPEASAEFIEGLV